jgi:hypothetical protein
MASGGLSDLVYGNGIDLTNATRYNPAQGGSIRTARNTALLDGHVVRGNTPHVPGIPTKVWGTDPNNQPEWRLTKRLKGSRYITFIYDPADDSYAVTLVN